MAKDTGWIKLHRSSFSNRLYFAEKFTKWQAWCDLLLLANHKEGEFRVRGTKVKVLRGQVGFSVVELAKRWRWSRGTAIRYLNELENEHQIVQQKSNVTTIISILNYEKFQKDGQQTVQDTVQQVVQQNVHKQEVKEIKEVKEDIIQRQKIFKNYFEKEPNIPTIEKVIEYFVTHDGTEKMARQFFNKNNSTGWKIGHTPIKDFSGLASTYITSWRENEKNGRAWRKKEVVFVDGKDDPSGEM